MINKKYSFNFIISFLLFKFINFMKNTDYIIIMHSYSKYLASPVIKALAGKKCKITLVLSHKIDPIHLEFLHENKVEIIYSFKKYGSQLFNEAVINTKLRALKSIFSFMYFLSIKKIWFKNFIVFEGVYQFTFASCFLSKLNLIYVIYVAHGVHRSSFKFFFQKTILFETVSDNDLKKLTQQFKNTKLKYSPYINLITRLDHIRSCRQNSFSYNLPSETEQEDVKENTRLNKVALFLGGFEGENSCFEPHLTAKMYDILQKLGSEVKRKYPDIKLVYRVHPSHQREFFEKTHAHIKPYHWDFSINNDYISDLARSFCVLSFDSSAMYESRDLGIPTIRIEFPELTSKIIEFNLEARSLHSMENRDEITEWIYQKSLLEPHPIFEDQTEVEKLYHSSLNSLQDAILN